MPPVTTLSLQCADAGVPFMPADLQHMQRCLGLLGLPPPQMSGFLAFKLRSVFAWVGGSLGDPGSHSLHVSTYRALGTDAWKVSGEVRLAVAEVEVIQRAPWSILLLSIHPAIETFVHQSSIHLL